MPEAPRPLKRHPALVPLSREHHEGLLLVWKIRQGLKNGTGTASISAYLQWCWQHHLQPHFEKEETVLAPHLPVDEPLVKQMMEDHRRIKALVAAATAAPDEPALQQVADALYHHIRFEERELFPFAEKTVSPLVLAGLPLEGEKVCAVWDDPFWLPRKG